MKKEDASLSDLDPSSEYCDSIMECIEFGVLDCPFGEEVRPTDSATREFASQTLGYCLGYSNDGTNVSFSDGADAVSKDDLGYLQIAVEKGRLSLSGDRVLPLQPVTSSESDAMIASTNEALDNTEKAASASTDIKAKNRVKEIPSTIHAAVSDDGSKVTISGSPIKLSPGDKFVVYVSDVPLSCRASSVSVIGSTTNVVVTDLDATEAFESCSFNDEEEVDLSTFSEAEGVQAKPSYSMWHESEEDVLATAGGDSAAGAISLRPALKSNAVKYNKKSHRLDFSGRFKNISIKGNVSNIKVKKTGNLLSNHYLYTFSENASYTTTVTGKTSISTPMGFAGVPAVGPYFEMDIGGLAPGQHRKDDRGRLYSLPISPSSTISVNLGGLVKALPSRGCPRS